MIRTRLATFSLILAAASLSACSTVKMPNLDFLKSSEFEEDAKNIGDYPSISDTPTAPTDIRPAAKWDAEAKALIEQRDAFNKDRGKFSEDFRSEEELAREAEELRAKVRAYKLTTRNRD